MPLVVSKVPFFWAKVHFIIVSLTITCTPSHCVTLQRKKCWPFVMSERGLKPLPGLDSQTGVCSAVFLSPSKQLEGPMAVECLWEVVNRRLNRLLCVFFLCVLVITGCLCISRLSTKSLPVSPGVPVLFIVLWIGSRVYFEDTECVHNPPTSFYRHQRACTQTKTFTYSEPSFLL